jgi:hypothetical protein
VTNGARFTSKARRRPIHWPASTCCTTRLTHLRAAWILGHLKGPASKQKICIFSKSRFCICNFGIRARPPVLLKICLKKAIIFFATSPPILQFPGWRLGVQLLVSRATSPSICSRQPPPAIRNVHVWANSHCASDTNARKLQSATLFQSVNFRIKTSIPT